MFELKGYHSPDSLDQADKLLHGNKGNIILGGLLWMRLGRRSYHIGIDLSHLGLDQILETEDGVEIGCMTTLRQIETSRTLKRCFGKILSDSVSHIVGVQFRNSATIGGSVFSRFNFSDILTALLAIETQVHLYRGGPLPLSTFLGLPPKKDILVKLTLKKRSGKPITKAIEGRQRISLCWRQG